MPAVSAPPRSSGCARPPASEALEESSAVKLRALRGATTVDENSAEAILAATDELLRALIDRNALDSGEMVSCIFTCTDDLDAEFPAVAARRLGLSGVPLLCAREIDVPGALPRVIRVLLHTYADPDSDARHVYLRDAVNLRADLEGAQ
jgi:chorismate mutase